VSRFFSAWLFCIPNKETVLKADGTAIQWFSIAAEFEYVIQAHREEEDLANRVQISQ
jgi:hypothetical protein